MTDEEALEQLSQGRSLMTYEAIGVAASALREKVAAKRAEKPKRPSVTTIARTLSSLVGHVEELNTPGSRFNVRDETMCRHAADILSALDREVVPRLKRFAMNQSPAHDVLLSHEAKDMLRAIGEDVP